MRAYTKFCLITALLLGTLLIGGWYVFAVSGFAGVTHIKHVFYSATFLVFLGVIAYISIGRVILRLDRDEYAIGQLDKLTSDFRVDFSDEEARFFHHKVLNMCRNPTVLGRKSRVVEAVRLLGLRHDVSWIYKVKTPVNRSVFQQDFRQKVGSDRMHLDNIKTWFFMAGFIGLLASLYVTSLGLSQPKTLEEIAQNSGLLFVALNMSYLLTLIGFGTAALTHLVKMLVYDPNSAKVFSRFQEINFAVIFPVLHASMVRDQELGQKEEGAS